MSVCDEERQGCALYPLFIDLKDLKVLVVGAGAVAARKIAALLDAGARVSVVAPEACPSVRELADKGLVELEQRAYAQSDLEGALLVVAATDDSSVNQSVYDDACERNMLVNVVDVPELCNAFVPSVLKRGMLQIAVSTSGAAPSLARNVRRSLEDEFPAYWQDYVALLSQVRPMVKSRVQGPAQARSELFELLTDGRLLADLAAGKSPDADEVFCTYIEPALAAGKPLGQEAGAQ